MSELAETPTGRATVDWSNVEGERRESSESEIETRCPSPPSKKKRKRRAQMTTSERRLQQELHDRWDELSRSLAKAEQWLWTKEANCREDRRWSERSRWLKRARQELQVGAMLADRALDGRETFY